MIATELRPGDYHWHLFQYGDGTMKGGPRFNARKHRVFKVDNDPDFARVQHWLESEGLEIDGWNFRDVDGVLFAACWRFRAGQEAAAAAFHRTFVTGTLH